MIVYFNDRFMPETETAELPVSNQWFMPKDDVRISPDDRGFTFGDGIYEVLKAYSGRLFKTSQHLARLERSLAAIRLLSFNPQSLVPVLQVLLERNNLTAKDAKIYIQITRGEAPRDHAFPGAGTPVTIFIAATPVKSKTDLIQTGAKAILIEDSRWMRCDIKQIGLLSGVLANQEAKEAEAYEALFVRDGFITEGTHTNFCAIIDGKLHTHPANNYILSGITRAVAIDICQALNIPVIEEPIAADNLLQRIASGSSPVEALILGTITEIMPIVQIGDQVIGDGQPGKITNQIQQQFSKLIHKKLS